MGATYRTDPPSSADSFASVRSHPRSALAVVVAGRVNSPSQSPHVIGPAASTDLLTLDLALAPAHRRRGRLTRLPRPADLDCAIVRSTRPSSSTTAAYCWWVASGRVVEDQPIRGSLVTSVGLIDGRGLRHQAATVCAGRFTRSCSGVVLGCRRTEAPEGGRRDLLAGPGVARCAGDPPCPVSRTGRRSGPGHVRQRWLGHAAAVTAGRPVDDDGQPFVTHGEEGFPVYYSYAGEPLAPG